MSTSFGNKNQPKTVKEAQCILRQLVENELKVTSALHRKRKTTSWKTGTKNVPTGPTNNLQNELQLNTAYFTGSDGLIKMNTEQATYNLQLGLIPVCHM